MSFKPEKPRQKEHIALWLPSDLSEQLRMMIEATGMKKQVLLRQMIKQCIDSYMRGKTIIMRKDDYNEKF